MAFYHLRSTKRPTIAVLQEILRSGLYSGFRILERSPGSVWIDSPDELFHLVERDSAIVGIEGEYLPSPLLIELLRSAASPAELRLIYDRRSKDDFVERCLLWKKMHEMQDAGRGSIVRYMPAESVPGTIDFSMWMRRLADLESRGYLVVE